MIQAAVAAASALGTPLGPSVAHAATALPAVGSRLELPDLPLIEGGTFRASEVEDRVVMIYWWASWCPFCVEMTPHVEKLWRGYRDRGLAVLGISIDKGVEAPREYRRKRGYTFPSAMYDSNVERHLPKPKLVPVTWVRDRKGRVVSAVPGQMFPEDVAEIAKFL